MSEWNFMDFASKEKLLEFWDGVIVEMVAAIKDNRPGDGFVAAVERCGVILAQHFPPGSINRNELPNKVVIM